MWLFVGGGFLWVWGSFPGVGGLKLQIDSAVEVQSPIFSSNLRDRRCALARGTRLNSLAF